MYPARLGSQYSTLAFCLRACADARPSECTDRTSNRGTSVLSQALSLTSRGQQGELDRALVRLETLETVWTGETRLKRSNSRNRGARAKSDCFEVLGTERRTDTVGLPLRLLI